MNFGASKAEHRAGGCAPWNVASWRLGPWFAGAAVSVNGCLPQIPWRCNQKSLLTNECFVEG
jgi:hypothetical protein